MVKMKKKIGLEKVKKQFYGSSETFKGPNVSSK